MKTLMEQIESHDHLQGRDHQISILTIALIVMSVLSLGVFDVTGQTLNVSGTITDETGDGVPGVNILVKGTSRGTATNIQGQYVINIDGPESILVVSAIGFETQEITIGQRNVIDVRLSTSLTELNEIVVTGYSTINKKDISSSITIVDVDEMKKLSSSNIGDQLQGKVAGVQVATTGDPASFSYVRVRGLGTINNNEPLYVIDGVPVQNEVDLNFLNPYDIQSIQVLKDAASASIYGARAANGVIVITTRKGRGKAKVSFDFFTGMQQAAKLPDMISSQERLDIEKGAYAGAGQTLNPRFYIKDAKGELVLPDYLVNDVGYAEGDPEVDPSRYVLNTTDPDLFHNNHPIAVANKQGTDWFEELFRPSWMLSAQLSVEKGDENGSHYVSFNYYKTDGVLIKDNYERFQTRLNNEYFVGKKFRLGENVNFAYQTRAGRQDETGYDMRKGYFNPTTPVYDINGYWASPFDTPNPVADQNRWSEGTAGYTIRLTGNAFAEYDILDGLTFKTNFGLDYSLSPRTLYWPACPECSKDGTDKLIKNWSTQRNWVWSTTLNYNKTFGDHELSGLLGVEARDAYFERFRASGTGLMAGYDPHYRELSNTSPNSYLIESSRSNSKMVSAFVNANYKYRNKYLFTATLRTDGSSRFVNQKYGMFPGFSAGWRVTEESFLNNNRFINSLLVRASWGITGNNEVVGGDYPGFSPYGTSPRTASYAITGGANSASLGFTQLYFGNPDLKWETSKLTNIAFDATLNDHIDVTLEWYDKKTEDMIYGVAPPSQTGIVAPTNFNVGSMSNKGIDLQLNFRGKTLSDKLDYNIGIVGTHFTNKVLALSDSNSFTGIPLNITRTKPGFPISQFYGFVADGLWQSQQQIEEVLYANPGEAKTGRMKFKDLNGDGKINDDDRTFIGNPIPKFILGLNVTLLYKGFDFTAYATGVFGREIYNYVRGSREFYRKPEAGDPLAPSKTMLYEAGKTLPVLDRNDNESGKNSSYWVEDGSYFKLRNVVLGYSIPGNAISKMHLTKARIYFQAQNLFTLTKYRGIDPDINVSNMQQGNVSGRDLYTGIDFGRYPTIKQYILGLTLQF